MAYPASEMIANTIAEAINTASQMNAWDYISVGGVVTAGIGGVATAGLLFWEISKSRKERARIRSLAILQKIEKQHQKIISFLFKGSIPDNKRKERKGSNLDFTHQTISKFFVLEKKERVKS